MTQPNFVEQNAPAAPAPPAPPAISLLRSPDGDVYKIPAANLQKALARGYAPLTPEEAEKHQIQKEEEEKGVLGSIQQAGSSFLNQALLGVPGAIQEHTETPEEAHHRELVEAEHTSARVGGGILGAGASLLYGGELFKGAEAAGQIASNVIAPAEQLGKAALATKMAAKAVDYATQGAALAAPTALVHAAFGDPKEAAETLMWGVGAGAALGGGAQLLESGLGAAGRGAGSFLSSPKVASKIDELATEAGARPFGGLSRESKEWRSAAVDFAHEEGILDVGTKPEEIGASLERVRKKYGGVMDDVIKGLDGRLEHEGMVPLSEGGGTVSRPMSEFAIKPEELAAHLRSELDVPELKYSMNADMRNAVNKVIEDAGKISTREINGQNVATFEDVQNFASALGKKMQRAADKTRGPAGLSVVTDLDRTKDAASHLVKNYLDEAANKFAVASNQPELVGELARAKLGYAKIKTLEKGLAQLEERESRQGFVNMADELRMGEGPIGKGTSAAGAAIGGVLGGVPGAIIGERIGKFAGTPLDYMAKKWGEGRGMIVLSSVLKRAAKEGPEVFSAVMASEGAKRVAATMETVQDSVKRMAQLGIRASTPRGNEHIAHLLGGPDAASGLSHEQQFAKLGARLTELQSNPGALIAATAPLASAFQTTSPQVAEAYQQQMAQAVAYLHNALPKPPAPPAPFAPLAWSPGPKERLDFHDKAEIVVNPMSALRHVEQGTLSQAHLDSLQSNYPTLYGKMRAAILDFHTSHPNVKLPAVERASIGKFLGQPLSALDQPQTMAAIQTTYAAQSGGKSSGGAPRLSGGKMPKGKIKDRPSAASAFESTTGTHLGASS
jgi:hypothetical protein